ncbi:uncharacterized protein LOC123600483 [Leopardus geoffroyi]|uniref:uncharacterized protein LOC123600483 n=1 Tax=Leopardus geoffroyi TaxID=46844 RepID=UPI001E25F26A|nr:uncharacterized protein LOC123600483 [Leopardus geoffroyi]
MKGFNIALRSLAGLDKQPSTLRPKSENVGVSQTPVSGWLFKFGNTSRVVGDDAARFKGRLPRMQTVAQRLGEDNASQNPGHLPGSVTRSTWEAREMAFWSYEQDSAPDHLLLLAESWHRVLAAGAQGGDQGCPEEDPNTSGSSGVQHRWARLGKEVKVPQKKKILDSSDHLLSPNSSSNIHPSPSLAGCRSSTRLPWPGTRAGRGRGQGRAEGVACRRSPGAPPRAAGRAQSRRLHRPPPSSDPDAEVSGSNRERFREPLAASRKGEALVSEGEVSALELISGSPRQSGSPRRRLGGETSTGGPGSPTGCFCAASLPDPLSLQLSAHTHPHNGYRESELLKHHSENTADGKPLSPRQSFRSYKEDLLRTRSRDHQKKTTKS